MGTRKRRYLIDPATREKIKTTQLLNALQDHALGLRRRNMASSQIRAAEIVLRKSMPDLATVTLEGGDKPLNTNNMHLLTDDDRQAIINALKSQI